MWTRRAWRPGQRRILKEPRYPIHDHHQQHYQPCPRQQFPRLPDQPGAAAQVMMPLQVCAAALAKNALPLLQPFARNTQLGRHAVGIFPAENSMHGGTLLVGAEVPVRSPGLLTRARSR